MNKSSRGVGFSSTKPEMSYDVINFVRDQADAKELFDKKCSSVEEKYWLLEARDKVLRSRIPKIKVRVEFATRLFGTCPDMCPEKERYMRQYQRQLTRFEVDTDSLEVGVDHKKAIKQYSRSSADQDEPLPHELRPGPSLEMTLNYLLHHIVPLADVNDEDILGDWYNFLWDRTRSIRKDITQQQLTNLCVVSLMEKCARFHIHCSSRLCELDVHLFDPKLNDENLMKCLQSLEHLYDDLRRRDVKCPNEPEFRAYQVIMNLNEGDILLNVQQWPEWIFKSPQVQTAIKIHHFIFSKNFVGFFRLVKSFSYMFSCILHRYFYQVRYAALLSMCRSGGRKGDVQLRFSQVQGMLGYGGREPNIEFQHLCDLHGLSVDIDHNRIVYNRRRFNRPDSDSRVISREFNLIESKLTTTIAEAINGGPLSENPNLTYQPHNSFDDDGFLKPGLVAGESSANAVIIIPPPPKLDQQQQQQLPEKIVHHHIAEIDSTFVPTTATKKTKVPGFLSARILKSALATSKSSRSSLNEKILGNNQSSKLKSVDSSDGSGLFKTPFAPTTKATTTKIAPPPSTGFGQFGPAPAISNVFGGSMPSSTGFAPPTPKQPTPQIFPVPSFKTPFDVGPGAFGGGVVFGGNQPSLVPENKMSFGGTFPKQASIFAPPLPTAADLERERAEKLKLIDTFCDRKLDEIIQNLLEHQLQISVQETMNRNIEERKFQAKLHKKEEIRTQMSQQAGEKILNRLVPFYVSHIVLQEVEQRRWEQSVCELYANKAIESTVNFLVEPICHSVLNKHKAERERRLQKAINILKRLKLKLVIHKWLAYTKARILTRKLKHEQHLQDMLNFPASNPCGKSPKEILQHLCGTGISPNLIKTSMTTKSWLDKYERAESVAESFKNSVSNFVIDLYNKTPVSLSHSDLGIDESSPKHGNNEFKRHCWKRRWSNVADDSDSDNHNNSRDGGFSPRQNKSPRQELTPIHRGNTFYHRTSVSPQFTDNKNYRNNKKKIRSPNNQIKQTPEKSSVLSLLEEIKKFAEDAKKEKENFIKSEEQVISKVSSLNGIFH